MPVTRRDELVSQPVEAVHMTDIKAPNVSLKTRSKGVPLWPHTAYPPVLHPTILCPFQNLARVHRACERHDPNTVSPFAESGAQPGHHSLHPSALRPAHATDVHHRKGPPLHVFALHLGGPQRRRVCLAPILGIWGC